MPDLAILFGYVTEAIKIIGGLASFYALVKLRRIERRYLFKATMPNAVQRLDAALMKLSICLSSVDENRFVIFEILTVLLVDVAGVKRKSRGDTRRLASYLHKLIAAAAPRRYFWQARSPAIPDLELLFEIHGLGSGLLHSVENDLEDLGWSAK